MTARPSAGDTKPISLQALLLALLATLLLAALAWGYSQQQRQRSAAPLLPVTFAHADHTEHNCAACHHNFTDTTGQGFCYDCHKTDPEIAPHMEAMFHGLCRDCHIKLAAEYKDHGPVRSCQQCHVADLRP